MRVADVDIWGHLKYGELIVSERMIPRHDIYSYTAYGKPWIDHEWLSEAAFYIFYSHFGDAGLFVLKISAGLIIALFLFLTLRMASAELFPLLVSFSLAFLTLGHFAMFRPQIFTYLFMSFFMFAMCAFHFKQQAKFLYALPFVMMFWCNFHGGFFSGLGLLFMSMLVFRRSWKLFLALFLLSCALTLVNPYGVRLHAAVICAVLNPHTHQRIVEWKPPSLLSAEFPEYTLYLLLSLACVFLSRGWRREGRALFSFYVAAVLLSLSSIRHIPLFALLAAPSFSLSLTRLTEGLSDGAKKLCVVFALFLMAELSFILFPRSFRVLTSPRLFPVSCVDVMKKRGVKGNVFNPFEWGEYILYHLSPDVKVSMDGRYDTVYPWNVIEENYQVLNAKRSGGLRVPREEETQWAVLSNEKALTRALRSDRRWSVYYEDRHCVLFQKTQVTGIR